MTGRRFNQLSYISISFFLKYFHINNIKFNYDLEFNSNSKKNFWKHNAPLIEYCETLGINIPHYCYHKNLSISGNCRMCLIELKNSPKPVVSCAMSAKSCLNNNEVFTNSPLVKKARENILEFLLLNHPLDCPICDQGGECDLQDQSFFFGFSKKRFFNFKRVVTDKNIGPIVKTVMTRCIHCTRCVRFASEIAGIEDMGMFGRGVHSEIGTYVTKTFQSELSGNIIDLCPVGALTAKPYPFIGRSWELKNIKSIDFSDSFGVDLQIFLKNNKIIKILPGFSNSINSTNWISDKTRFSFDGMFSPERVLHGFINTNFKVKWKDLIEEIIYFIYFKDHLNKHFFKFHDLVIVFSSNISLEVLTLLKIFSQKYSFIKLRLDNSSVKLNDLEETFVLDQTQLNSNFETSTVCLLIGINTRYESPVLNLKLRKRYLKGNFKVFSLNSDLNLTFPTTNLGNNLNQLKQIVEGTHMLCQTLTTKSIPSILISSEILKRKDSYELIKLLISFKSNLNKVHNKSVNINVLNTSLNNSGISYIDIFKKISKADFFNSLGIYLLNINDISSNLKTILELKLLNYYNNEYFTPKLLVKQNNGFNFDTTLFNPNTYINLPNNVFFSTTNTYLTSEGIFKQNIKFLSSTKQTKDDWQIIRKLFSKTKNINFFSNKSWNNKISFNCNNFFKFKSYSNILFFASNILTKFNKLKVSKNPVLLDHKYKTLKMKVYNTPFRLWLDDFYIGGKDLYSKHSITMINCSNILKKNQNNFLHII